MSGGTAPGSMRLRPDSIHLNPLVDPVPRIQHHEKDARRNAFEACCRMPNPAIFISTEPHKGRGALAVVRKYRPELLAVPDLLQFSAHIFFDTLFPDYVILFTMQKDAKQEG